MTLAASYHDLTFRQRDGSELGVDWLRDGGAEISVGGDQPGDQRPCATILPRADLVRLAAHILVGLIRGAECGYTAREVTNEPMLSVFIPELSDLIAKEGEEAL